MKSIMQEASSIIKAIEQGWKNAGMPKEFSIKIFEEPKKNFIGLTVQAAKIGIFFSDNVVIPKKHEPALTQKRRHNSPHNPQARPTIRTARPLPAETKNNRYSQGNNHAPKSEQPSGAPASAAPAEQNRTPKEIWSSPMIDAIRLFFANILQNIHKSDVNFQLLANAYTLTIAYDKPVVPNEKQYQFERSCSFLLMHMLRHHTKRPLRGFKISIQPS